VFVRSLSAYKNIKGNFQLNKLSDLSDEEKVKYLTLVSTLDPTTYMISVNPIPGNGNSLYGVETINAKIEEIRKLFRKDGSIKPNEATGVVKDEAVNQAANIKLDAFKNKDAVNDGTHDNITNIAELDTKPNPMANAPKSASADTLQYEMLGVLKKSYQVQVNMDRTLKQIYKNMSGGKRIANGSLAANTEEVYDDYNVDNSHTPRTRGTTYPKG
jgi:hypothetical protein